MRGRACAGPELGRAGAPRNRKLGVSGRAGPEAGSPAGLGHLPSYAIMGLLRHYFHKHADSAYIGRHIYGDPRPTDKSGGKPAGARQSTGRQETG